MEQEVAAVVVPSQGGPTIEGCAKSLGGGDTGPIRMENIYNIKVKLANTVKVKSL